MSSTEFRPESSSLAGPSRKRPRSETSSEERKEARAHRNRIAAQNSRDRRKAQFSYLERRVAELEDENKRLRAGLSPADTQQDAKDRENQELRARIATLERGLEAVVKAFAVQGLPSSVLPPADISSEVKSSESTPSFSSDSPAPVLTPSSSTSSISPPSSTGSPAPESFPISPAPSHASLHFSFTPSVSSASPLPTITQESESESTRHLAAGELELYSPYIYNTKGDDTISDIPMPTMDPVDDAAMETLFHEILYSHSRSPSPVLGARSTKTESVQAVDLLQITGQTQGSQEEAETSGGNLLAQVSLSSLEGVKAEGSGSEEGAETKLSSLGMDLDHLSMVNDGSGFGFGLDMEMLNEAGLLEEENATKESSTGGFTATWLDDYTSSLLESFVPPAASTTLESDSSAISPVTASPWESLEASLSVGVGVF